MAYSQGGLIALSIVFLALSTAAVALRLTARKRSDANFGYDDLFIVIAQVFVVGVCLCMLVSCTIGNLGQHEHFGPDGLPIVDHQYIVTGEAAYFLQVFEKLANGLVKVATLIFFRRIFVRDKRFQIVNNIALVIVAVWTVSFFVGSIVPCIPPSVYWGPITEHPTKCFDELAFYLAFAITDLITDFFIVAMPIPMVWGLHMPLKRRIALLLVFMLGFLVVAISAARLDAFVRSRQTIPLDRSYITTPAGIWSTVESSLAVVASCLPTLRPLFRGIFAGSVVDSMRSRVSSNDHGGNEEHNSVSLADGIARKASLFSLPRTSRSRSA